MGIGAGVSVRVKEGVVLGSGLAGQPGWWVGLPPGVAEFGLTKSCSLR